MNIASVRFSAQLCLFACSWTKSQKGRVVLLRIPTLIFHFDHNYAISYPHHVLIKSTIIIMNIQIKKAAVSAKCLGCSHGFHPGVKRLRIWRVSAGMWTSIKQVNSCYLRRKIPSQSTHSVIVSILSLSLLVIFQFVSWVPFTNALLSVSLTASECFHFMLEWAPCLDYLS